MPPTFEQFLKEFVTKYKDAEPGSASGTPSTPYYTGPNSLFGVVGAERDVISTRVKPRGLASILPSKASNTMYPLFPYFTGFLTETGTHPDGVCDDPQTAGPGKSCMQTAAFGRYSYQTRELELNRLGQQINRGDFQDFNLVNDPLLDQLANVTPGVGGNMTLAREVLMRFLEVGISFQDTLMRQLYIGNPANNSANGGYAEFPGLDILIGTNKIDAITGTPCPSLRSQIFDFNYANVNANSGVTIYERLSYTMRYLKMLVEGTSLDPVTWNFVMRPGLFWELTAIWPCVYQTYTCNGANNLGANGQMMVTPADTIGMRDDMRRGRYLLIDGERYPVVLDDAIVEESHADPGGAIPSGCYASDLYIVPRTAANMTTLYWEYYNYNAGPMQGVADGRFGDDFWTDGGRFLWHKKNAINWCVQWLAKIEPRIVLHTPHIAARITNIEYCMPLHERDPFRDGIYHVDGGVQNRTTTGLYNDWQPNNPGLYT